MSNEIDPTVKFMGAVAIVLAMILMCGGIIMSLVSR